MCAAVHIKLEVLYGIVTCQEDVKSKLRKEATVFSQTPSRPKNCTLLLARSMWTLHEMDIERYLNAEEYNPRQPESRQKSPDQDYMMRVLQKLPWEYTA